MATCTNVRRCRPVWAPEAAAAEMSRPFPNVGCARRIRPAGRTTAGSDLDEPVISDDRHRRRGVHRVPGCERAAAIVSPGHRSPARQRESPRPLRRSRVGAAHPASAPAATWTRLPSVAASFQAIITSSGCTCGSSGTVMAGSVPHASARPPPRRESVRIGSTHAGLRAARAGCSPVHVSLVEWTRNPIRSTSAAKRQPRPIQAVVGSIIQSTRACRGARPHLHMPPIHPAS